MPLKVDASALLARRRALSLTAAEAAARLGLSERRVRELERRGGAVTEETLKRFADAYETPFATLLAGKPQPAPPAAPPAPAAASPFAPQPSTLSQLASAERAQRLATSFDDEDEPALSASLLDDLFTSYADYADRHLRLRGEVRQQKGIPHEDADPLGWRRGEGGRFLVSCPRLDQALWLTLHARTEEARALRRGFRDGRPVEVRARVLLWPGREAGFSSLHLKTVRPWTLVAADVSVT